MSSKLLTLTLSGTMVFGVLSSVDARVASCQSGGFGISLGGAFSRDTAQFKTKKENKDREKQIKDLRKIISDELSSEVKLYEDNKNKIFTTEDKTEEIGVSSAAAAAANVNPLNDLKVVRGASIYSMGKDKAKYAKVEYQQDFYDKRGFTVPDADRTRAKLESGDVFLGKAVQGYDVPEKKEGNIILNPKKTYMEIAHSGKGISHDDSTQIDGYDILHAGDASNTAAYYRFVENGTDKYITPKMLAESIHNSTKPEWLRYNDLTVEDEPAAYGVWQKINASALLSKFVTSLEDNGVVSSNGDVYVNARKKTDLGLSSFLNDDFYNAANEAAGLSNKSGLTYKDAKNWVFAFDVALSYGWALADWIVALELGVSIPVINKELNILRSDEIDKASGSDKKSKGKDKTNTEHGLTVKENWKARLMGKFGYHITEKVLGYLGVGAQYAGYSLNYNKYGDQFVISDKSAEASIVKIIDPKNNSLDNYNKTLSSYEFNKDKKIKKWGLILCAGIEYNLNNKNAIGLEIYGGPKQNLLQSSDSKSVGDLSVSSFGGKLTYKHLF